MNEIFFFVTPSRVLTEERALPSQLAPLTGFSNPSVNVTRPVQLVGRLDNRRELADKLGLPSRTSVETLVMKAYHRWGDRFAAHFFGEFAVALWDNRLNRLFCATDIHASRPLYWAKSREFFACSASVDTLLKLDDVDKRLNLDKITDFLLVTNCASSSFYLGIKRVPPASVLILDDKQVLTRNYWHPKQIEQTDGVSVEEAGAQLVEALETAVSQRLPPEGGTGVLLSSGLDSTAVASIAAPLLAARGDGLLGFTATPHPQHRCQSTTTHYDDERPLVQRLTAAIPNLRSHFVNFNSLGPFDGLAARFSIDHSPVLNSVNQIWIENSARIGAAMGIRSLLAAPLGNSTISFDGLTLLPRLLLELKWRRLTREISALARKHEVSRLSQLRSHVLRPLLLSTPLRGWIASGSYHPLIGPALLESSNVKERLHQRGIQMEGSMAWDSKQLRSRWITHGAFSDLAPIMHGIHERTGVMLSDPTADRRLIELMFSFPDELFLRDGTERFLIRFAMRNRLPSQIVNNQRRGRQSADWYLRSGPKDDKLRALMSSLRRSDIARHCLNVTEMQRYVDQWPSDGASLNARQQFNPLLRALEVGAFILWFDRELPF